MQNVAKKKLDQRYGANQRKQFFANFCCKFLTFSPFLSDFCSKTMKKHTSTSIWSAQHPNAGQYIQHWDRVCFLCRTAAQPSAPSNKEHASSDRETDSVPPTLSRSTSCTAAREPLLELSTQLQHLHPSQLEDFAMIHMCKFTHSDQIIKTKNRQPVKLFCKLMIPRL